MSQNILWIGKEGNSCRWDGRRKMLSEAIPRIGVGESLSPIASYFPYYPTFLLPYTTVLYSSFKFCLHCPLLLWTHYPLSIDKGYFEAKTSQHFVSTVFFLEVKLKNLIVNLIYLYQQYKKLRIWYKYQTFSFLLSYITSSINDLAPKHSIILLPIKAMDLTLISVIFYYYVYISTPS